MTDPVATPPTESRNNLARSDGKVARLTVEELDELEARCWTGTIDVATISRLIAQAREATPHDLDDAIERAERLLKRLTELRATDALLASGHIERLAEENERYRAALEKIAAYEIEYGAVVARAALERQT